jgi:long-chain fatty acid transport protein
MTRTRFLFCILAFFRFHADLHADGFQYNLQGQKQAGMGHAGTGTILDASSIFFNPAAVTFLDSTFCFNLNVHFIFGRVAYAEPAPGNYRAEMMHNIVTPFSGYLAVKLKPHSRLSIGLGIYTPFGDKAQWEDNWKGKFISQEMNLLSVFVQPTVAYKLTDKLGIGLGLIYASGSLDIRKALPLQFADGTYGGSSLHGTASGYGYNGGVFFKASDKLTVGLNYRSSVGFAVSGGTAQFTVPQSAAALYPATTFSSNLNLPSVISLGAGYRLNNLLLALDINYTGWKTFDSLHIDFAQHTSNIQNISSARMWQNAFSIRAGTQYIFNDWLQARAGVLYAMSPVKDGYLTLDMPDANKLGFTAGVTYKLGKHSSLDGSVIYEEGFKRTDTNLESQFAGTYQSRAVILGIGIQTVF